MIRRGSIPWIALLLLALTIAGCRWSPPPPRLLASTTGAPLAIDDARAERVLETYLDLIEGRRALRGSARVALSGPDFKLNRPQRVIVERPARLRFEILGLFDQLAAVLVTDGRRFGFFDAASGQISRGPVSAHLLWDLAKIDLSPEEAVGLLLGTPEPVPGLARSAVWLEPDGRIALAFAWPLEQWPGHCEADLRRGLVQRDCFVAEAALAGGGEVFFFDEGARLVELRSLESDGLVRFLVLFEQYEALEGGSGMVFPKRVTIRSPSAGSEARFDWKRVMLASELSDRLFRLPEQRNSGRGD
ncbi:MAG: hypothetical protein GY910_20135 [bacterium]|nr:hypothetical protein [Deltaproteobacteria bacterium]MCP4907293.1 hypothetical protein [bacterium]